MLSIKIKNVVMVLIVGLVLTTAFGIADENLFGEVNATKGNMNLGTTLYVGGSGPGNYTHIQDAIENASDGDIIKVYPGTYNENVDVYKQLTIKSTSGNPADTIAQAANSNDHVFNVTANWVNITGFTVENATGDYAAGIYLYDVERCNITNNIISSNGLGIYLNSTHNSVIDNNTVSDSMAGIGLENSTHNNVTNNRVNNTSYAIALWQFSHFNKVINNTISNTTAVETPYGTMAWAIEIMGSNNNLIDNNYVFDTIASGTDANPIGICVMGWSGAVNNNTISNNEIYNTAASGENASAMGISIMGYYGPADNNTIADNKIYNTTASGGGYVAGFGIYVYGTTNSKLINNNISFSTFGIMFFNSSNNLIKENEVGPNDGSGIFICQSNDNDVINNTANGNSDGIHLDSSSDNTIGGNTANSNTQNHGIWLWNSSSNTVMNNTANENNEGGICLDFSDNNTITDNTANENNHSGIQLLQDSYNNTVTNNTAKGNNGGGICLESSSNNTIYNNYFKNANNAWDDGNNTWNISKTEGTNIIGGPYLGGNYWSDYAGEDTNADGIGDTDLPYNCSCNIQNGGDWLPLVLTVIPPENSTVCGYIWNETSDPIQEAEVNIWSHDYEWGNDTQTNESGYYEMNTIPGNLGMHVHANGYFDEDKNWFYIEDGETKWFNFTLQQKPPENSTVCGFVNDSNGNTIKGAGVGLHDIDRDRFANGTDTNSEGYYEIGIYSGHFYIDADKGGYFNYHDEIEIGDDETLWINITLERKPPENSTVCGYVNDANGEPIIDADVWLHDLERDRGANGTRTNSSGYYEMGIYEEWFNIGVHKDGYFDHEEDIDVPDNQTMWINIILEEMPPMNSTVCGYVNDTNGEPIIDANAWLHNIDRDCYVNGTKTNETGYYEIGTYAGHFNLRVHKDGYFDEFVDKFYIEDGETKWFNFTLQQMLPENSTICGYVNGSMIKDATVWIYHESYEYYNSTKTNESGYYEMNTFAGYFYIGANKDEYFDYQDEIDVPENETLWYNITLEPRPPENSTIDGYVYDNDMKEPIANASVLLFDKIHYQPANYTTTNETGYYNMSIYAGNFLIITDTTMLWEGMGESGYQTNITNITILPNTALRQDIYLDPAPESQIEMHTTFEDWNNVTFVGNMTMKEDTNLMRFMIDMWVGNNDGFVNETEAERYIDLMESEPNGFGKINTTEDFLLVDDNYYIYVNDTFEFSVDGFVDSIYSIEPIIFNMTENCTSTIPSKPLYEIKCNVTYDTEYLNYTYYLILPSNYAFKSNETCNSTIIIEDGTIIIDPPMSPDPENITWEWIEMITVMTDNNPPYKPTNVQPSSGETGVSLNPTLRVHVRDPDGHPMSISFYDNATNEVIGTVTNVANDSDAQVTWSGLSYSTTYEWYVIANDSILENRSDAWSFTTRSPPNQPPNTPSIPSGSSSGYTGTSYSYSTSATDPDGDRVQYRFDWGDGTYSSWTSLVNSGSSASASHSWSSAGTYYVKAQAKDEHGATSSWSSTKTVSITVYVLPKEKPSAPRNLTATTDDTDGEYWIKLMWDEPESDGGATITNYSIYRGNISGGEVFLKKIGNVTTYNDTGLEINVIYYYEVSAINSVGEGPKSEEANATTIDTIPPTITNAKASPTKVEPKEEVIISANVTDSSGIDRVFVIIKKDGKEIERINLTKGSNDKWSILWKPGKEGTYDLTINVTDIWGNEASANVGSVKVEKKGIPGFGFAFLIVAIATIILLKRRNQK